MRREKKGYNYLLIEQRFGPDNYVSEVLAAALKTLNVVHPNKDKSLVLFVTGANEDEFVELADGRVQLKNTRLGAFLTENALCTASILLRGESSSSFNVL